MSQANKENEPKPQSEKKRSHGDSNTQEKKTDSSGDAADGTGEDNKKPQK